MTLTQVDNAGLLEPLPKGLDTFCPFTLSWDNALLISALSSAAAEPIVSVGQDGRE